MKIYLGMGSLIQDSIKKITISYFTVVSEKMGFYDEDVFNEYIKRIENNENLYSKYGSR